MKENPDFELLSRGAEARRVMIEANLAAWSRKTAEQLIPQIPQNTEITSWPFVKFVPRPVRRFAYGGVTLAGLAAAACSGGSGNTETKTGNFSENQPKTVVPREAPPLNPNGFLDLPFLNDGQIKFAQGWFYVGVQDDKNHLAVDYIDGSNVDEASTWKSFAARAPAGGKICREEFETNFANHTNFTIRIRHANGYETRILHLDPSSIGKDIPECTPDKTKGKVVERGDEVAKTGDSGTTTGWIHLHLEIRDPDGNLVDPYDLKSTREAYPDPNFTNGRFCGPKTLWRNCPIDPNAKKAERATPIPTVTPLPTVEASNAPTFPPIKTATPTPTPEAKSQYPKGKGGLNFRLTTPDKMQLDNYLATLWKVTRDKDGNITNFSQSQAFRNVIGENRRPDTVVADAGEYALSFPYLTGPQLDKNIDGAGILGVFIKEGQTNMVDFQRAQLKLRVNDARGNPYWFGHVCIYNQGNETCTEEREEDNWFRINLFPGDYEDDIVYSFYASQVNLSAALGSGSLKLAPGQALNVVCNTNPPKNQFDLETTAQCKQE